MQERIAAVAQTLIGGHTEHVFPAFDDLPKRGGVPDGSIWGFYDKYGKKDEIGCTSFSIVYASNSTIINISQLSTSSPHQSFKLLHAK